MFFTLSQPAMGRYSITDIEKLTEVKAHTLRIWEKRYNLFNTKRTDTNIRFYDDEDLRYLLNVSLLLKYGHKISKVAAMTPESISEKVLELGSQNNLRDFEINSLISAMTDFDEIKFEKLVSNCLLRFGVETTVNEILYPFLEKIGVLWQIGSINPAQEHFMSNLIRQKLIVATDGLSIPDQRINQKFLLFLPEGELHEIGLLFANFIIRTRGNHTLYLGQNVPINDLVETNKYYQADFMFTIITSYLNGNDLNSYLLQLSSRFSNTTILVSGAALKEIAQEKFPQNLTFLPDVKSTLDFLLKAGNSKTG